MTPTLPTLLIFSDDWGRHPSSCQHLMRHLLARYRVLWVNTIGMRSPRLDRVTLDRAMEKARHWLDRSKRPVDLPTNLRVLNPRMWPWIRRMHDRRINQAALVRQLTPILRHGHPNTVAVTTLPLVADLVGHLPVDRWVYYCVDNFSQWPGLEHSALLDMEEKLARSVDVAVAVSPSLQEHLMQWGRTSHLLTHGVDTERWRADGPTRIPPTLADLPRPWVLFWGLIDRRMDLEWVETLGRRMTEGTILLVGPRNDPDDRLFKLPRVAARGRLGFDELPHAAASSDVLIMPYADLPVTRAMQPLKLKEYLATGKPVVARRLPAVEPWAESLDAVGTAEEFAERVLGRLGGTLPERQEVARGRLEGESWAVKAEEFERLVMAGGG